MPKKQPAKPKARRRQKSTAAGKAGWRGRFLKQLAKEPNVAYACRVAGVTQGRAYQVRAEDGKFREEWDWAVQAGIQELEHVVHKRASTKSDVLAIFLLKAYNPAKYRETTRTEVTGPGGGAVPFQVQLTTDEVPKLRHVGVPEQPALPEPPEPNATPEADAEVVHIPEAVQPAGGGA